METVTKSENNNLKKQRIITGAVYVVVLAALVALKWCVPAGWGALGFDAVFCAISVIGTLEFLRATDAGAEEGKKLTLPQRAFTIAFCALVVPLYVLMQLTAAQGMLAVACAFTIYVVLITATSVFDFGKSTLKGTIYCIFCMFYCGVFSTLLAAVNHLSQNSMAAVLVLFLCPMLTDSGAYVIGTLLKKKIPLKLAPALSPNKTVIGSIGGLLGGILGAVIAFVLINYLGGYNDVSLIYDKKLPAVVAFILIGLFASVVAQFGDLFESAVKRECGIKDMGNILPGHGGVLDRFDSMLFCGVVVLFCFGTIFA